MTSVACGRLDKPMADQGHPGPSRIRAEYAAAAHQPPHLAHVTPPVQTWVNAARGRGIANRMRLDLDHI